VGAAPAGGARRRQASAGRGALAPASFQPGQGSVWRARLYWVLGKAPGQFAGEGRTWGGGSAAAVPMARQWTGLSRGHGTPVGAREMGAQAFYR
jgi:hypothetical protein